LTVEIEVYQQEIENELTLQQPTKPSPALPPAELKPRLLRPQMKPNNAF